jgi:hypothetical protein
MERGETALLLLCSVTKSGDESKSTTAGRTEVIGGTPLRVQANESTTGDASDYQLAVKLLRRVPAVGAAMPPQVLFAPFLRGNL